MKLFLNRKFLIIARLSKPARVLLFVTISILFAVCLLLAWEAGIVYRRAERTLEKERQNQSKQTAVSFSSVLLEPHLNNNVQIIQSTRNVRAVAGFQNTLFAATGGGLVQMSDGGAPLRHFTVLDGLPESDLTALAVYGSKLFIGTKAKGLISFDGERFESFRLENHETKSITSLLPTPQTLLIGTFSGGLLEFDGSRITEIKAAEARLEHITLTQNTDSCLIVGTFAGGLWIRKNQIWKHFTTHHGLQSNRVVGAEILNKNLYVATDLGVAEMPLDDVLQDNPPKFRQSFMLPTLSSIIAVNDRFYMTKEMGEIFVFFGERESYGLKKTGWKSPAGLDSAKLFKTSDEIWLLTGQGIWKSKAASAEDISLARFSAGSYDETLTDNNVSALAIDRDRQLWVGTFRRGIDVFSSAGKKLKHLESETVREINFLTPAAENDEILAATTGGAIRFDRQFRETFFAENTALPSRVVTQIKDFKTDQNQSLAISTAKGLLLQDKNSKRVFSSINGLPSGSVFAVQRVGEQTLVGTMSGLATVENGKVARVFKTSNSELKNNWVSALAATAEGRIFIGTYGGGIFELLPSGEIRSFESETGKFFVNPNALHTDGERLFAGTLEGVWSLDLSTQNWSKVINVLPSETVLSITASGEFIYVGTTGGIARIKKTFWVGN